MADVRANNRTRTKLNEFDITKRLVWAEWNNVPFYMRLDEDVKGKYSIFLIEEESILVDE